MPRRRPKGTGAVRKLPSGRWQARIDNGAGLLVSLGSYATKTDAAHALSVALGDQARGRWTDPDRRSTDPGGVRRGVAGAPIDHRRAHGRAVRLAAAQPHPADVRRPRPGRHLDPSRPTVALADAVRRQPGAVTVAKSYRLLRSILATAVEDGLIANNPCVIKGAGVERSPERPVATIPQVFALAEAVEPRYRMLILLATFASMRFGELGALTRSSIDLDTGLIDDHPGGQRARRRDTQSSASRRPTPVAERSPSPTCSTTTFESTCGNTHNRGNDGLVFVGPAGGPLRRSNWSKTWRTATTELGLGTFTSTTFDTPATPWPQRPARRPRS